MSLLQRLEATEIIGARHQEGIGRIAQARTAILYDLGEAETIRARNRVQQFQERFPEWNEIEVEKLLDECRKYLSALE